MDGSQVATSGSAEQKSQHGNKTQRTSMNIIEHSFSTCLSCTQQNTPVTRGNKSLNHQDGGPSIPGLSFPPGRTEKTRNGERKQRKPKKKQKTRDHKIR